MSNTDAWLRRLRNNLHRHNWHGANRTMAQAQANLGNHIRQKSPVLHAYLMHLARNLESHRFNGGLRWHMNPEEFNRALTSAYAQLNAEARAAIQEEQAAAARAAAQAAAQAAEAARRAEEARRAEAAMMAGVRKVANQMKRSGAYRATGNRAAAYRAAENRAARASAKAAANAAQAAANAAARAAANAATKAAANAATKAAANAAKAATNAAAKAAANAAAKAAANAAKAAANAAARSAANAAKAAAEKAAGKRKVNEGSGSGSSEKSTKEQLSSLIINAKRKVAEIPESNNFETQANKVRLIINSLRRNRQQILLKKNSSITSLNDPQVRNVSEYEQSLLTSIDPRYERPTKKNINKPDEKTTWEKVMRNSDLAFIKTLSVKYIRKYGPLPKNISNRIAEEEEEQKQWQILLRTANANTAIPLADKYIKKYRFLPSNIRNRLSKLPKKS